MPGAAALIGRADGLVTYERIRNYSLILLVLSTSIVVGDVVLGSGHMLATGDVVMTDYLAHWTGGRLLLDGQAGSLYDPAVQLSLQQTVGQPRGLEWFVAPPTAALFYVPFAWLPTAGAPPPGPSSRSRCW